MASYWFLILLLKCIDFLSWPVLALVYPLYASIEAIESESHSESQNLISYWILLSLIYRFEYALLTLLRWFQYWRYIKLIIVAFLVTPDFGRAAYVYNHLIKSCIYMNPQAVVSRFRSWKNIFAEKEDFLTQAEKYIPQNRIETFEKLLASKNTEQSIYAKTREAVPATTKKNEILKNTEQSIHAKTREAVPATSKKNEILKELTTVFVRANRGRLLMEQKDIKDLEMIQKVVLEEKQDNAALHRLKSNESTSSAMAKTEKMPADTEHGTFPQSSAHENVQKEWTCAICLLTMPSEANLNSHLRGRNHKAACEAMNMKINAMLVKDTRNRASLQVPASENAQETWTCVVCQLTKLSKANVKSHLKGKRHRAACEALNTKTKAMPVKDTRNLASLRVPAPKNVQETWNCVVCQLTKLSKANMKSHLKGKKHRAACEALNGKSHVVSEKGLLKIMNAASNARS